MHEARHDPGDGPQLEGLQTQQAADAEGGTHDREAGETAEARTREEAQAETSGDPHLNVSNKVQKQLCRGWFKGLGTKLSSMFLMFKQYSCSTIFQHVLF